MELIRCFFCLPLPEPLLRGVQAWVAAARAALPSGVRWVAGANLHITLRFCGEIPAAAVRRLDGRAAALAAEQLGEPLALKIGRTGTFGRPAKVLWAGLEGETARLRALNAALERACAAEGLEPDAKSFSPHLTLARFSRAPLPGSMSQLPAWTPEGAKWAADRVIFMRSRLTPSGPRYSPIAEYHAGGRGAGEAFKDTVLIQS